MATIIKNVNQEREFLGKYNFDAMEPGDAIDCENPISARQSFYGWRIKTKPSPDVKLRFVGTSPDNPSLSRFIMVEKNAAG